MRGISRLAIQFSRSLLPLKERIIYPFDSSTAIKPVASPKLLELRSTDLVSFVYPEIRPRALAHLSKVYKIVASAASTSGQLPALQAKAIPVVSRLAEQYAAALYCAKRSRLSKRDVAIASATMCQLVHTDRIG